MAKKSRKVGQVRLSNGKIVSNVRTVNGLMQQKAMPVAAVKFEGWFAQPVPENEHPLLRDESLAETLARHNKEAKREQEEMMKRLWSKKKRKDKNKKPEDPQPQTIKPSKFAECLVENESKIVQPEFPVKTVTVGSSSDNNNACRGCMKVRTLQESLSRCSSKQQQENSASLQGSSHAKTLSTCSSSASSVHFGTVEIRSYSHCLGDNPACSSGPPIALDWKYRELGIFGLDEFDDGREPEPPFQISNFDRVELLRNLGYTRQQLREAEKQRKKDQGMREETIYRLKFMDRDEQTERVRRRLKGALRIKGH